MKKRLVTFLIGLAVTFNGLGIQGFCDKKVDVSIDNIKNIMLDNSIDMTIMDNNLKNTKGDSEKPPHFCFLPFIRRYTSLLPADG